MRRFAHSEWGFLVYGLLELALETRNARPVSGAGVSTENSGGAILSRRDILRVPIAFAA
jgi:hypothetical protein